MGLPPFQETSKYSHSVGHNCWSCQSTHCEILCTVRRKGSWTLRWSRVSTIQEQFETPQVPATLCNFHISIYAFTFLYILVESSRYFLYNPLLALLALEIHLLHEAWPCLPRILKARQLQHQGGVLKSWGIPSRHHGCFNTKTYGPTLVFFC